MLALSTETDPFNALADARRRRILELLGEDERSVGDVVDALGVPQPQVSKHLRALREAGLVSVRADGKRRLYSLRPDQLKAVHDWVRTFEPYWDRQLDRIKRRAEERGAHNEEQGAKSW